MMMFVTVPDPDFERRGGGGGDHLGPSIRGGRDWSPKKFFRPLGPQFGLKIEGGGAGLPGRFPGSATVLTWNRILLML